MLGVRERAEAEQDRLRAPAGSEPMWYQGCTWLTIHGSHVVQDDGLEEHEADRGLDRAFDGARARASRRARPRRGPSSGAKSESMFDVPGACTMASSPPPSPAIAADSANATMRARVAVDPDRRRRDLAAAQRVERSDRSCRSRTQITTTPTITRMTRHSTRKRLSLLRSRSSPSCGRGADRGTACPPPTQPSCTITLSKKNANASVASERKMPPSRSAGSASSAPTDRRDHRADDHRDQHRHAELRSRAARSRHAPIAGERRLAQRDLAGDAGDHGDRQEDDREDRGLDREVDPRARWRGRTGSSRRPGRTRPPKTRVALREARGCASTGAGAGGGGSTPGERIGRPRAGCAIDRREDQHEEQHDERQRGRRLLARMLFVGQVLVEELLARRRAARPPANASGMLVERRRAPRPRSRRSRASCTPDSPTWPANTGASSTPARPARRLDSIHDAMLTRSEFDAGELGHPRALHDRPHAQAERGVAEQQRRARRTRPRR